MCLIQSTARESRVRLRLPETGARRWHVFLLQALERRGHPVEVEFSGPAPAEVPGLTLLRLIEQTLYQSRARGENDAAAAVGPSAFRNNRQMLAPDLVLDLTAAPRPCGNLPVLVPVFDGIADPAALVWALIEARPAHIGWQRLADSETVAAGTVATRARHILTQGLSEALASVAMLAPRAAAAASLAPSATGATAHAPARLPPLALPRFALGTLIDRVRRRADRTLKEPRQWNIGWRPLAAAEPGLVDSGRIEAAAYRWLPKQDGRYFADPFPFEHQGRLHLFCEEFVYATGRGLISVMDMGADGGFSAPRPVLEHEVHLSYPCVFRWGDGIYMLPETSAAATLELYRAEAFPLHWRKVAVLAENMLAVDATFFEHDGLCWIAAATAGPGTSDRDSCSLFFAERPEGPWTPHPGNPVVVDAYGARPAGHLQRRGDRLLRPAQDCSQGYGWGLSIRRIDQLDRERFSETELVRLSPPSMLRATGLHTVNRAGSIETIDAILP